MNDDDIITLLGLVNKNTRIVDLMRLINGDLAYLGEAIINNKQILINKEPIEYCDLSYNLTTKYYEVIDV
jgi:hypothetical protein